MHPAYPFHMPARDLVMVHLVARDAPGAPFVTGRQMGQLLGLILSAGRDAR